MEPLHPYYKNQERKAMELVGLWLKWIVLPTIVVVLVYGLYLAVRGM